MLLAQSAKEATALIGCLFQGHGVVESTASQFNLDFHNSSLKSL